MTDVVDGPVDTAGDPSSGTTTISRGAAQDVARFAEERPDHPAVDTGSQVMTYGQLHDEVERLASGLLARLGSGPARVGLRFVTALDLVVADLAVDRAGLTAVPIDPTSPGERLATVLVDAGASLLLVDERAECVDAAPCPVATIADLRTSSTTSRVDVACAEDDLAMLIPTSGSTGVPKSVMVTRGGRRSNNYDIAKYGIERYGCLFAGSFGPALSLLTPPFTVGATLVTYHIGGGLTELGRWLHSARIDTFPTIPTLLRHVLDSLPAGFALPDLRTIAVFGESASWRDVERLHAVLDRGARIINAYGSSETGAISMFELEVDDATSGREGSLPVGSPADGKHVEIHDETGAPLPVGVAGEIIVSGRHVNAGYWGRPDLTARVFVDLGAGRRMVRTGDRGRLLSDGSLEHLGRVDHMVKISGNRVELGEVETALGDLPGVAAAAATTRPDPAGHERLLAWVVPARESDVSPTSLRAALARRLPGFMLPDMITLIDELPRLSGGKVDRAALPARPTDPISEDPADPTQRLVAAVFAEVLGMSRTGIHDDFFEMGGDSLRAARVMVELELRAGIVGPASLLIEHPTAAGLADVVRGRRQPCGSLVAVRAGGDRTPLALVHGLGGQTVWARTVADSLPSDLPIYALCTPLLDGRRATMSVVDLAQQYVRELRRARPEGPYAVFGYSFGGLVALEMGRELRAAGAQVTVLLGDTPDPAAMRTTRLWTDRWRRRVSRARSLGARRGARRLAGSARADAKGLLAAARLRRAAAVGDRVPVAVRAEWIEATHRRMAGVYRPDPYGGPVVLLRSEDRRQWPGGGWEKVVTSGLRVVEVSGRHEELVYAPYASSLAAAILEQLENSRSDTIASSDGKI